MVSFASTSAMFSAVSFFLLLAVAISDASQLIRKRGEGAASPAQIYWHTNLPNTPMPRVIMDQLVEKGSRKAKTNYVYRPLYYSTASDSQFPSDPALFFLEKDLHPGAAMKPGLSFIRTISDSTFLPRSQAESIPFSSAKLSEILYRLSVLPGSPAANEVKKTLEDCDAAAAEGEHKHCATSLESLVDFVAAELETHSVVVAATTTVSTSTSSSTKEEAAPKQRYVVEPSGVRRMPGAKLVACHPEAYPHSVYYCHLTRATRAYVVQLVGEADGTRVEAVAACHSDTAKWRPVFFKVLGVKPGEPICHFLPQDHLIWTPTK